MEPGVKYYLSGSQLLGDSVCLLLGCGTHVVSMLLESKLVL